MAPPCSICASADNIICYPDDHALTICPDCCARAEHPDGETGHQYSYEPGERDHFCDRCGDRASYEWHCDRAMD